MVDLPSNGDGLAWILRQEPARLLLVPGLQPASIAAAALGDQQAQAYLRFEAQEFAAIPGRPGAAEDTPFGWFCHAASQNLSSFPATSHELQAEFQARQDATVEAFCQACCSNQVAAAKWLRALCDYDFSGLLDEDGYEIMEDAASRGNLDVLKYLRSGPHPAHWDEGITSSAVSHPACLRWLLSQGCPVDERSIARRVASTGDLDLLKFLRTELEQLSWSAGATQAAAERGDLPMVQWLRSLDPTCDWDSRCMAAAAAAASLPMLQWMRTHGCPFDEMATQAAAAGGHMEALQYLHAEGCPWDATCTRSAVCSSSIEIVSWLRTQQPPCPWDASATEAVAQQKSMPMLQWLLDQEPPCPLEHGSMAQAASNGHLDMLKFLLSRGGHADGNLFWQAAQGDHIHVLKWLHKHRALFPIPTPVPYHFLDSETPTHMFLGDMGIPVMPGDQRVLDYGRKRCATFHGLLRWCRRAVSDPSRGFHRAFDHLAESFSGQYLLVRLSMLPPELVDRIAIMAKFQHDMIFGGKVCLDRIDEATA